MGRVLIGLVCALVLHVGTAYALRCGTELVSKKGRCFKSVDFMSEGKAKLIAIDE